MTADRLPARWPVIYATVWLPVFAVYYAFIAAASPGRPVAAALLAAANVLPAALFGIPVLLLCRRVRWKSHVPHRSWHLVAVHVAGAAAYTAAWCAGIILLFSAARSAVSGTPVLHRLSAAELQWQLGAGLLAYTTIVSLAYVRETTQLLREEEAAAIRSEALRTRAELQALRARLDPHFLFNTLHSLLELVGSGDPRAEEAVERTGNLFRYVYDKRRDASDDVPLRDELTFVNDYMDIEQLRLGDRLHFTLEVDEDLLDAPVPAMLIQPLVENAVRHAASRRARATAIRVAVRRKGAKLTIRVEDDGPGADPSAVSMVEGSGLGLVSRRLQLRYGGAHELHIATRPGDGFRALLTLPLPTSATQAGR